MLQVNFSIKKICYFSKKLDTFPFSSKKRVISFAIDKNYVSHKKGKVFSPLISLRASREDAPYCSS